MAQIAAKNDISMLKIRAFLGLNENPDGDTTLKNGEMAEMRNFRVTQDRHLQIRPGCKAVLDLRAAWDAAGGAAEYGVEAPRFHGAWHGSVTGVGEVTVAAFGGGLFSLDFGAGTAVAIGKCTQDETSFFGFGGKVYLLNGHEFMCWDGSAQGAAGFAAVEGYVPLIQTAATPAGAGTLLEPVNRLTGKRRARFSPDGSAATFQLPETGIDAVLAVTLNGTAVTAYTSDLGAGTVTMSSVPASGVDTLEITYRKGDGDRGAVERMRFSELYNGAQDTRVFLYGDGSNRCIYSGIPYDSGKPSAEYFPDLYELGVGEANTPLTALVRHYSRMLAFKPESAWSVQYGSVTLAGGSITAAFYVQPVNRQFGNEAPGQARLLENDPLTLDAGGVYQWKSGTWNGYYSGTENNVKRVSDRVAKTLAGVEMAKVRTVNVKSDHEYWFFSDAPDGSGRALIYNYANDSWYRYDGLPYATLLELETAGGGPPEKYGFGNGGLVARVDGAYRNDCGTAIDCYAATGAMDFDRDWLLKYSPMIFVAMQPESGARLYVTVETNRRGDYPEKLVSYGIATFKNVNFAHFSFATNRKPQVKRVKMKVKKATFYRLIFQSNSASAAATVIETDVKLRYGGNVK